MQRNERGFTLVELAIATVVLLVGVVAVMELVPRALQLNLANRMDTTSTGAVQRLLDLMMNAGVPATQLVDSTGTFPCSALNPCNLGPAGALAVGDFTGGSPLLPTGAIDFNAARVPGFNFRFQDPNDPAGIPYDIRWAVITSVRNVGPQPAVVVAKRYIVGARREGTNLQPVTLTTWATR